MDLPPSETLMVKVFPDREPVTDEGFGGLIPSSFLWRSSLISARRHSQSALVVTLEPLTFVNGSGSFGVVPEVGFVVSEGQVVLGLDVVGVLAVVDPLDTGGDDTGVDTGVETGVDTGGV